MWHIDLLLGKDLKTNNETTAIAMQQRSKHASTTTELLLETVFSTQSMQRSYLEVNCQLKVEFCMGGCEDGTRAHEAEESPLLEAVGSKGLMKTQQAGKRLSRCCGDT
jgi:hypothetical protein